LQITGTVDTDLSNISANEMMIWGLANLWKEDQEGAYLVRHGLKPASDFGRSREQKTRLFETSQPNFFEKAFPCLFPYGCGGVEAAQEVTVSFQEHVKWSLQYHDRRFRTHEIYPFVAFGILQRREALGSARLQMIQKNFIRDARVLSSITPEILEKARTEEENGQEISDARMRLLKCSVYAVAGRVKGSNQARYRLRSQIWSTSVYLGPPYLWITINPSDLHDPIAQIFAGEKIDLDNFVKTSGPDSDTRAQNIAKDPYAGAKFFHFMIRTIFETLFKVEVNSSFRFKSEMGILGRISAFFGTVESQGRGTLHLHLLLWMWNAPTGDEMKEMLKDQAFRDRITTYIKSNLRAHLPGLESAESIKAIPSHKDVAYSRPPNPSEPDYDQRLHAFEQTLARSEQVHVCKPRRCLVPNRQGRLQCKRKAPFKCSLVDFITEAGQWGPKRLNPFINGWVPGILVNA
jgi:hypothetical protein